MARPTLPPFAVLRAFERIGRVSGIRKAALELGISHAIVSRHLAALERHLGVSLFNRRTGELSTAGRAYHARIAAAIAELESATASFTGGRERALIIWCSAGFSLHWLAPRLFEYQRSGRSQGSPLIDLRSTDAQPAFERDEPDGDIRYLLDDVGKTQPDQIRTELLVRPNVFPVASPALLARHSLPLGTQADLLSLPLVHEGDGEEWALWLKTQGLGGLPPRPPAARFTQAHLALMAARAGQGVALANHFLVADDLARGSLVALDPMDAPWRTSHLGAYYFRCSRARWTDPPLARFRRWLKGTIERDIDQRRVM